MIKPVTAMNTLQSKPISASDIDDVNIQSMIPLVTPAQLKAELPLTETAYQTVLHGRETIRNILDGKDKRIFVHIISAGEIPLSTLSDILSTIRHSLREKVP